MPDIDDRNTGGADPRPPDDDRPLRWSPAESSIEQRLTGDASDPPDRSDASEDLPPTQQPALPSWERLEEEGIGRALLLSLREILFEPAQTFSRLPREPVLGRPLLFLVLLGTIGTIVATGYQTAVQLMFPELQMPLERILEQLGYAPEAEVDPAREVLATLCAIVLAPFVIAIVAFIWAGIIHLFLMFFGAANYGYETTFRTVCYVSGATWVFALIPFCGQFPIRFIWTIVCTIIGLSRSQETESGRAAAAVLLPYLLCCLCVVAAALLFVILLIPVLQSAGPFQGVLFEQ
jgi:hypothetical protein